MTKMKVNILLIKRNNSSF